jgi:hypothetical protein
MRPVPGLCKEWVQRERSRAVLVDSPASARQRYDGPWVSARHLPQGCPQGVGIQRYGHSCPSLLPCLLLDAVRQLSYLVVDASALRHELPYLAVGVHHCRVVPPPELLTDLR